MKTLNEFLTEREIKGTKTEYTTDPKIIDKLDHTIYNGHLEKFKEIFNNNINPNQKDSQGTPLAINCASNNRYAMLKYFIDKGYDINTISNDTSVMLEAIDNKNEKMIDLILDSGVDVNQIVSRNSYLYTAMYEKLDRLVKKLIDHKADVNFINPLNGNSLLMSAIMQENRNYTQWLIEANADVTYINKLNNSSPLSLMQRDPTFKQILSKI